MNRIYRSDQYARECCTVITDVMSRDGLDIFTCESSVFYPEGGGQPSDTGTVSAGGNVYKITSAHDTGLEEPVWHYTDAPEGTFSAGDEVNLAIDWDRRFINMQCHLGEHMLSGTFDTLYGGVNKGFHMGQDYIAIDIDLGGRMLTAEELDEAECMVNEAVWEDLPVRTFWFDDYESSLALPVRKKVPHEGRISVVTVGDPEDPYDCIACCGTHPSSSGQVGLVTIYKCEPNKGMNRVFFDCGRRALERLKADHDILTDVARRYSCSAEDLISRLDTEAENNSSIRSRLSELAAYVSEHERSAILADIAEKKGNSYTYSSDILSTDELLKMGFAIIKETDNMLLVLMRPEDKTCLLLSSGDAKCGGLVKEHAKDHGGRGGGRDDNARAIFGTVKDMRDFATAVCKVVE